MWLDTSIDEKLKKYLQRCEVYNLDNVKSVHAFGFGFEYDVDGNPANNPKLVHHRVFNFDDLAPEYNDCFLEYHRIMVIFQNGGTVAWDFFPSEWESINEKIELELSSAE